MGCTNGSLGNARIITSTSNTPWKSSWKPGGTLTCVAGNTIGRILEQGVDPHGLGRWTYIRLMGRNKKIVTIFGAYCVPINSSPGASTAYFQQRLLLMTMQDLGGSTDP